MEHEVFVPVPAERLRDALADPARVARAVPGLQQDAGTEPVAGRLKVRIGGHTITYRGTLRVTGRDDGSYAVDGEATEARGTGTVKLSLSVRLLPAQDGTTVAFTGTATGDGRVAELPGDAVASAGARLLGRFAEQLGESEASEAAPEAAEGAPEGSEESPQAAEEAPEGSEEPPEAPEERSESSEAPEEPSEASVESSASSVFDAEVPPSSLDPFADEGEAEDDLVADGYDEGEQPVEAAHARRTMIGRSAEEVDHAPPRGRYAPVPAPETIAATATLRWAAPAAALLLASAIVAGRLLRRRR
ncbi:SRPBCC family protein [Streptomyces yaanensis]|uniref:SRPBCC family protein n=1 Tax=Streptomyces yaanensis TaxID=1142239 RepID=A0ABV7S9W1_9ACTN|nr:SRPBCC family protein [Streptomyces sp. CGMCC 4.7035]WNB96776.1 SRPBCC family protein [Streptomyces sp. CGMCC 4.7035]